MYFHDRLKRLRSQSNLTQFELSKAVGVSAMTVKNWESGSKLPSMPALISLSNVLHVSSDELLGITESFVNMSMPVNLAENRLIECYRTLDSHGRRAVDSICSIEASRVSSENNRFKTDSRRKPDRYIPKFITPSAAGYSFPLDGDDFEMMLVDDSVPNDADFAVRIQGNSMEPYIFDGDTVFVKKQNDIKNGDVGIFSVNGSMYCKIFYKDHAGNVTLISANHKMKESNVFINFDSGESLVCYGVVIMQEHIDLEDYIGI